MPSKKDLIHLLALGEEDLEETKRQATRPLVLEDRANREGDDFATEQSYDLITFGADEPTVTPFPPIRRARAPNSHAPAAPPLRLVLNPRRLSHALALAFAVGAIISVAIVLWHAGQRVPASVRPVLDWPPEIRVSRMPSASRPRARAAETPASMPPASVSAPLRGASTGVPSPARRSAPRSTAREHFARSDSGLLVRWNRLGLEPGDLRTDDGIIRMTDWLRAIRVGAPADDAAIAGTIARAERDQRLARLRADRLLAKLQALTGSMNMAEAKRLEDSYFSVRTLLARFDEDPTAFWDQARDLDSRLKVPPYERE